MHSSSQYLASQHIQVGCSRVNNGAPSCQGDGLMGDSLESRLGGSHLFSTQKVTKERTLKKWNNGPSPIVEETSYEFFDLGQDYKASQLQELEQLNMKCVSRKQALLQKPLIQQTYKSTIQKYNSNSHNPEAGKAGEHPPGYSCKGESNGDYNLVSTSAQSPEPSLREGGLLQMLGQTFDQNFRKPTKLAFGGETKVQQSYRRIAGRPESSYKPKLGLMNFSGETLTSSEQVDLWEAEHSQRMQSLQTESGLQGPTGEEEQSLEQILLDDNFFSFSKFKQTPLSSELQHERPSLYRTIASTAKNIRLSPQEVVSDSATSKAEPRDAGVTPQTLLLSVSQKKEAQGSRTDCESLKSKAAHNDSMAAPQSSKQSKGAAPKKQAKYYDTANLQKAPCSSAIPAHFL